MPKVTCESFEEWKLLFLFEEVGISPRIGFCASTAAVEFYSGAVMKGS